MRYNVVYPRLKGPLLERLGELYFITGNCADLEELNGRHLISTEVFLSDDGNQRDELLKSDVYAEFLSKGTVIFKEQSPANGSKICLLMKSGEASDSADGNEVTVTGGTGDAPYKGDLTRQTAFALEQTGQKLAEEKLTMKAARCFTVRLKDFSDYDMTDKFLTKAFPDVPHIILFDGTITGGWLINIYCRAER